MTRREEWLRVAIALLTAGKPADQSRLVADEMLAEADERWPSEQMVWRGPVVTGQKKREGE